MKILLISYSDYDYDGRLRELINVFKKMGELKLFVGASHSVFDGQHTFKKLSYRDFIKGAEKYARSLHGLDLLVVDNRRAIFPALMIKRKVKCKMILDCRELYFPREVHHFAGKVGCYIEKPGIKKADIIICANKERAEVMRDYYKLQKTPLVFENLRKLIYSNNFNEDKIKEKFAQYLVDDEIRIISTSGCIISRTSDVLVENLDRVNRKCRLILVGEDSGKDRIIMENVIKKHKLSNVVILGKVNQDELKFLIHHSHIGVVNYNQNDFNNKYCASGKLYEFIYEGIPVVTTTNPPLKRLCDEFQIGVADDTYANGINKILCNYEFYKRNAEEYGKKHTVQANNERLRKGLIKCMRL